MLVNYLLVIPADWKEIQSVPEATSQGKTVTNDTASGLNGCSDASTCFNCVMSFVNWEQSSYSDKYSTTLLESFYTSI